MVKPLRTLLSLPLLLLVGVGLLSSCKAAPPTISALTLEPQGAEKNAPDHLPVPVILSAAKPESITKEPKYRVPPKYGSFTLGGEGGLTYSAAVDEPAEGAWKIYLDANHNGDLTDDAPGDWTGKQSKGSKTIYGPNHYVLDVSWKLPDGKTSTGKYGVAFIRAADTPALLMVRMASRTGTLELEGKAHKLMLMENDSDALFSKTAASQDEAKKGRPVWLMVDLNDDRQIDAGTGELVDVRGPFKLADHTYEAAVSPDGASIKLTSSSKVAWTAAPKEEPKTGLPVGTEAPNFKVAAPNGEIVELAKYRGQIVVLDFWSTWCGPCQRSMPHVEEVFQKVKGQQVAVLAVCVFDEKENYKEWLPQNKGQYHFQFAFDPAGRDDTKSVASTLYKVDGIPATYVIDKEGKIAASISGFDEGDTRIEEALRKLGVSL
jgi:peroxiredoxin